MQEPLFLTLAEVIEIHRNQVELYGGHHGVRDMTLSQGSLKKNELAEIFKELAFKK